MWAESSEDIARLLLQQTPVNHPIRAEAYGEQTEKPTFGMPQMAVTDVKSPL